MRRILVAVALLVATNAFAQIGLQTAPATAPPASGNVTLQRADEGEPSDTCTVKNGWWPTQAGATQTLCLFNHEDDQQEYLKYARFFRSTKTMSAATDLVNDAFGPVYVSFSAAVAATTDDDDPPAAGTGGDSDDPTADEDKTLNLLRANGGNLALTASLPIYYRAIGSNANNGGGNLLWNSYVRFAANVDAMGGDTTEETISEDDLNGNIEVAFTEVQADLLSFQRKFNLLGYLRTSAIIGTDKFAESLGDGVSSTFLHGQLGTGVRIAGNVSVYFTYNWYSDADVPGNGAAFTFVIGGN